LFCELIKLLESLELLKIDELELVKILELDELIGCTTSTVMLLEIVPKVRVSAFAVKKLLYLSCARLPLVSTFIPIVRIFEVFRMFCLVILTPVTSSRFDGQLPPFSPLHQVVVPPV
jgi:hypothetical protein